MAMGKACYPQMSPFIPTWPHPYPHYTYIDPPRNTLLPRKHLFVQRVRSFGVSLGMIRRVRQETA